MFNRFLRRDLPGICRPIQFIDVIADMDNLVVRIDTYDEDKKHIVGLSSRHLKSVCKTLSWHIWIITMLKQPKNTIAVSISAKCRVYYAKKKYISIVEKYSST